MNNSDVIRKLDRAIEELEKRRREVDEILDRPIKPAEFPDVEKRVLERVSSLTLRIHNLRTRSRNRQLLAAAQKAVPPLSPAQVQAMQTALQEVSRSIKTVKNIQTALATAAAISQSASDLFDATATA
jgi:hypothetical protein